MSWYVLKTKPRQENRAVTHLENQSFMVYCPWLIHKDGSREALFTGYMFIRLDQFAESFITVRSTRGVQSIIKYGEWWATADEKFIDYLKFRENGFRQVPLFEHNQEVTFKEGPFKGLEAVYLSTNGKDRAMVMLTILNRRQTMVVDEKLLKAV